MNELGDFLRSRREKTSPSSVGLSAKVRRRTPGLRREEVAALAGIGVDWYIRLEQGRCVQPSSATIDAVSAALRLSAVEHAHLRTLSRHTARGAWTREAVPEELAAIVRDLVQPAYITGRRWDVLAWNAAAEELFGWGSEDEADRNVLVHLLTKPRSRRAFGAAWPEQARRVVAQFRASFDAFAEDEAFVELVRRLRAECPEFAGWWRSHDVRASATGTKILHHPRKGPRRFAHASFLASDDPNLKLVIYRQV